MPISDEIIELAPIKKSKSKMIILFVIMGVFFAAAAAFLVLYLLKPSATVSTGAVLSVEESPVNPSAVEGAKPLFQKSGSGNSPEYYATVGVQYTVAVKVSTEGEVNNQVSWVIEPSGAVERIREGSYEYGVTTVEDGAQSVHYLTFSVFPENAGEKITITARSQSDSTLRSVIEFNAVCQGAESISFTTMQRNVSGATVSNVTSDNITLPYYETSTNSYLFGYQQLGAFNGTDYADIAEVRKPDGTYTNKVAIESSNTSVAEVRVVETATRPIVEINLRKAGDTNITIKANVNNDSAEEVTKTIRLTVKNSKELGYIDDIRIIKEVTSKEYFASLKTMPASITSITLPYGSSFNDILSHIVLSPTTLQYDATGNKLIDSWKDSIEITSSDRSIVSVSTANGVVSLNAGSTLSSDCTLTIRDKSPNGLGTSRQLKVNVVGQNRANGIETAVTIGGESYIDSYVARNNLPISQGLSADINVTYIVSAPATTSAATLNKFISSAYRLEFNKSEISVKLSGTALEPYNPNPEAGQKSNEYDITNDLEFAKEGNTTTFKATVKFVVTIMDEAENGVVSFSFIKVGTELPNADNINLLDATVTKTVNFQVTNIARNVMLKTADIPGVEESALDIITAGGTKPGKIVEVSPPTQTGDRWTLKYNVYIQYDNQNAPLWFKPQDLIYVDGPANMTGPTYSDYRSGSLALTSDGDLMFSSYLKTDRSSANASIKYTNSSGATIGDVTIVIFVINGVDRIVVGDSSVATVKYSGSGSEKASFSVDKVTYQHIYGSSTSDSNEPYDFNIKYGADSANAYLVGEWNTGRTEKIFKYVFKADEEEEDEDEDEDDDEAPTYVTEGTERVSYNRSLTAKLSQLSREAKEWYSEL
ncbi:MAG: hypothetical protein J1F39_00745, partial [Clostridiales bacterium]|nr:hypothetical protein [Clostridiales bacterium]